jgi:hypothetical protein
MKKDWMQWKPSYERSLKRVSFSEEFKMDF